eukprot:COSAG01_NODE_42649_length_438_cov_0.386431_1_plen_59_part_00
MVCKKMRLAASYLELSLLHTPHMRGHAEQLFQARMQHKKHGLMLVVCPVSRHDTILPH